MDQGTAPQGLVQVLEGPQRGGEVAAIARVQGQVVALGAHGQLVEVVTEEALAVGVPAVPGVGVAPDAVALVAGVPAGFPAVLRGAVSRASLDCR